MKPQKNPKYDLKLQYRKALELGTIGAIGLILICIYTLRGEDTWNREFEIPNIELNVENIPPTEQIKRPPSPLRPSVPVPTESEEIPQDMTIETTELNLAQVPPPPPPPTTTDDDVPDFVPYDEPPLIIGGMETLMKELQYPDMARKAGVEARVIVAVLVDTDGKSIKTRILKSTVEKLGFEEEAVRALMRMKWKPAYQRDLPVKVWISIPVAFRLRDLTT